MADFELMVALRLGIASLVGLAFSPVLAGFVGATGLQVVFVVDVMLLVGLGIAVARGMRTTAVEVDAAAAETADAEGM